MARLGVEVSEATLPAAVDADVTVRGTAYHLLDLGPEPFRSFNLELMSGPGMETGPRHIWSSPSVQREANSIPFPLHHVRFDRPGRYTFRLTTWSGFSYRGDSDIDVRLVDAWSEGDPQTRDGRLHIWGNNEWLPLDSPADEILVRLSAGQTFIGESVLGQILRNPQDGMSYLITAVNTTISTESGVEVLAQARPLTAAEISSLVADQADTPFVNRPLQGFSQLYEGVSMGCSVDRPLPCPQCQESSCGGCEAADEEPPKEPPPLWYDRLGKLLV